MNSRLCTSNAFYFTKGNIYRCGQVEVYVTGRDMKSFCNPVIGKRKGLNITDYITDFSLVKFCEFESMIEDILLKISSLNVTNLIQQLWFFYPRSPLTTTRIAVVPRVCLSSRPSVRPDRRYRSSCIRVLGIRLRCGGAMDSTMKQTAFTSAMLGNFSCVLQNFEISMIGLDQVWGMTLPP